MLATEKADGTKYWEYVLLYVDDVMVIHHDALSILVKLDKYFKPKASSIGKPQDVFGRNVEEDDPTQRGFGMG